MPITANILYRESFNFFKNQLYNILFLALLSAFITVILNQMFLIDVEQFNRITIRDFTTSSEIGIKELVNMMTPEQQIMLLKILIVTTISTLVGNILLIGSTLTLITLVSKGNYFSLWRVIYIALPILPRLGCLTFFCMLLVQFGFALFIVPGFIIALSVSLSPIMIMSKKISIFDAIKSSAILAFSNIRLIVPAMILWFSAKLLILIILSKVILYLPVVADIILHTLNNLISISLLIYLFRLHMLLYLRSFLN